GQGAQIVFANAATMSLSGDLVIPCGRTSGSGAPIAITTLQADVVSPGGTSYLLTPTGGTSSSNPPFVDPGNITTYADNVNATATNVGKHKIVLSTTGFNAQSVTDGSTLTLHARHSESKNSDVSVTVTAGDGSTCPKTLTSYTSMTDDAVVLDCPAFHEVEPFTVSYTAQPNTKDTNLALDGLQITGTSASTIPKLAGCAVHTALVKGTCALISPPSNGKGRIDVNAVVYIPQSTITGKFSSTGHLQIGVGVIAWALDLAINPNIGSAATIGTASHTYTDGDVRLTASIDGSTWIDSRVQYPNGGTTTPVITSWDIQR
ncbi:MAG TPA: hypothetical protein VFX21_01560, partial [Acidimicrobiia bacterium]|nr:hypothetical protein [Acidimicrobiia bacterium]